VAEIELPEFNRFQNLRKKIVEIMYNLLKKSLSPCNQMVKNLILIEDAYINTYHPDFMGGANAIFNVFDPSTYAAQKAKMDKLDAQNKAEGRTGELNFEEISENALDATDPNKNPQKSAGLFGSWFPGSGQEEQKEENAEGGGHL
jgi:vacuolar protein sorting-associated protein 1